MVSSTNVEKNLRKVSNTNDDDNDVVCKVVFYSLLYFAPTHDDPGCQGQARMKNTSTILPLEDLWWMIPETN